jgi:5'(3')-deoxyribonucleotidase
MGNARFVLGVDLDGVVADFYGGLRKVAAEWLEVPIHRLTNAVTYGLPEWEVDKAPGGYEALHRYAITQRELFLNLQPIAGAALALRRLSAEHDVRIRVITHRLFVKYFHQTAIRQTVEWLDKYDIPYWDLCFMRDKAAVGADLYIEDAPKNILALREDGHPTIVFSNSTNSEVPPPRADNWAEAHALVVTQLKEWEARQSSSSQTGRQLAGT